MVELLALVEPFYPDAGLGRRPVGLAIMLRTCRAICCWEIMLPLCGGIGE